MESLPLAFAAPEHAAAFRDEGFVIVPLLDAAEVRDHVERFARFDVPDDHAYHASNVHLDRLEARRVDVWIKDRLMPRVRSVVTNAAPILGAYVTKGARVGAEVQFHLDWTFTDERRSRSALVWIPLVDVDEGTGALRAVPGSHRWAPGVRPSGGPSPLDGLQDSLAAGSVPLRMRAGEAAIIDNAVLHGSFPNPSDQVRLAVGVVILPEGAPILHFHVDDEGGSLTGREVDESYFSTEPFAGEPRVGRPVAAWAPPVTTADIEAHLPDRAGTGS